MTLPSKWIGNDDRSRIATGGRHRSTPCADNGRETCKFAGWSRSGPHSHRQRPAKPTSIATLLKVEKNGNCFWKITHQICVKAPIYTCLERLLWNFWKNSNLRVVWKKINFSRKISIFFENCLRMENYLNFCPDVRFLLKWHLHVWLGWYSIGTRHCGTETSPKTPAASSDLADPQSNSGWRLDVLHRTWNTQNERRETPFYCHLFRKSHTKRCTFVHCNSIDRIAETCIRHIEVFQLERKNRHQSINRSITHSLTHSLTHLLTYSINQSINRCTTQ